MSLTYLFKVNYFFPFFMMPRMRRASSGTRFLHPLCFPQNFFSADGGSGYSFSSPFFCSLFATNIPSFIFIENIYTGSGAYTPYNGKYKQYTV